MGLQTLKGFYDSGKRTLKGFYDPGQRVGSTENLVEIKEVTHTL